MSSPPLRLVFLNQYYPPDTSATSKVLELMVETLSKRYQITIIAGRPSYNPTEYFTWLPLRRLMKKNIQLEYVGSTAYSRGHMGLRTLNYFSYLAMAFVRAMTIKADIIFAMTDPPLIGFIGAVVARLRGKLFLYNIQDLHPDMAIASGLISSGGLVKIWEWIHRWTLQQADRIIVLGEDMKARILMKNIDQGRVRIIRNGTFIPTPPPLIDPEIIRSIRGDYSLVVIHAGNLGFYGAWETLIRAFEILEDDNIGLIFIGGGAAKSHIKARAKTCPNIKFLPFRPPEEVPSVLAAGDIHIVTIQNGIEGLVVPSKIYPLLAAGRPILAVASELSEAARIVNQNHCGLVADPDDPLAVANAIKRMAQDRDLLAQMSKQSCLIAPEYETQKQLDKLIQIMDEIV